MILLLMQLLASFGIKVPHAFMYVSTRMVFAAITGLGVTILWGSAFIRMLYGLKIGHLIRVSSVEALAGQYQKSQSVPSMGGLLFLTGMLSSSLLWMDLTNPFTIILVVTAIWMGFLGACDDYLKIKGKGKKGVSPRTKMFFQLLFSALLGLYLFCAPVTEWISQKVGISPPIAKEKVFETSEVKTLSTKEYATHYYIPFYKKPIVVTGIGLVFAFLLTLCVITGSTNAVNLSDGLDGLATGLALLVALVLAIVAFVSNHYSIASYLNILYIEGSSEIAIFLCALMGACFGFLWFNGYPAQVFMGDTGSLALGGILGVSALLLRREFLYLIVGGVFVMEALSVILQVLSYKYRKGKRIFRCAPIHHHFEMGGWHEVKVVTRFWMLGLLLALIGLVSLKMQ